VQDLTDQESCTSAERSTPSYSSRATCAANRDEHQAPDGPGLLSRAASSQGLPFAASAPHTNARTRKGKAKPIAGKKK
jgi:hypothetical protein